MVTKLNRNSLAILQLAFMLCAPAIAADTNRPLTQVQTNSSDNKLSKEAAKEEKKDQKNENKVRPDAPCLSWVKIGVPIRAVLLCVHGLGLASDSWTKFGEDMSKLGVATYAIDVRGFGSWVDAKGRDKCDFDGCMNDVSNTLKWLQQANPKKPIFLMGESMGGAIALHVAAKDPQLITGVISVCSSGDRFKQKRTDLKVFLHMLAGPRRKFDIGDKIVDQASGGDVALKRDWEGDKLDQMKLSPLELMQFQHFMNENHDEAKKIDTLPVLMVQGRQDPLVKPEGTEELFNELSTPDKQIMMVENAKHLIFEEQQFSDLTLAEVASWLFKHCPPVAAEDAAFEAAIEKGKAELDGGQLVQARADLQNAIKLKANDANAHYLMGLLNLRMKEPLKARLQLILASRFGKGTQVARDANNALLTLPQNLVSPTVAGKKKVANLPMKRPGVVAPKSPPTVLVFNATWCQPGQEMIKTVEQAQQKYGTRVKFQIIDVDDKANASLVDQYSIGPVPTTIFLTPGGDVSSMQVGYAGMEGLQKGIQTVLPAGVQPH